jgi:hypothetical protein
VINASPQHAVSVYIYRYDNHSVLVGAITIARGGVSLANGSALSSVIAQHVGDDSSGEHVIELTSSNNGSVQGAPVDITAGSATLCLVPSSAQSSDNDCLVVRADVIAVMPVHTNDNESACDSETLSVRETLMGVCMLCSPLAHLDDYVSVMARVMTPSQLVNATTTAMGMAIVQMSSPVTVFECVNAACTNTNTARSHVDVDTAGRAGSVLLLLFAVCVAVASPTSS